MRPIHAARIHYSRSFYHRVLFQMSVSLFQKVVLVAGVFRVSVAGMLVLKERVGIASAC